MPPDRARELQERLLVTFRAEANEHLAVLSRELEALDCSAPEADLRSRLEVLFRTMHTLKGAARSVGFGEIEKICHLSEATLRNLRESAAVTPEVVRVIQDACDAVGGLLGGSLAPGRFESVSAQLQDVPQETPAAPQLPAGGPQVRADCTQAPPAQTQPSQAQPARPVPPAQPAQPSPPTPSPAIEKHAMSHRARAGDASLDTIRVEIGRLDKFNVLAEDLLIPKLASADRVRMARGLLDTLGKMRTNLRTKRGTNGGSRNDASMDLDDSLRKVTAEGRRLLNSLRNDQTVIRTSVDALLDEIRRIRMMPAALILEAFPRMVRDLSRDTGKEVAWQVSGADIEIDRKILDLIKDPLIHMVRNAVDHGIEGPQERISAGKSPQGKISVAIERTDGRVVISVRDDGRGLDLGAIRSAAVRARAISAAQVQALGDEDVADLAFRSGVSTSPVISSISGNGVGLAIVRERVERIEGRLSMRSVAGQGTTITLDLPTSIATYRGFLVGAGTGKVLWPFDAIERAIIMPTDEIEPSLARGSYTYGDQALPVGRLSAIMGYSGRGEALSTRHTMSAIVVRSAARRGILLVDEVLGESEIVIKEIRSPLQRIRNVMTAGLLGTGELVLVARPSDVLASIRAGSQQAAPASVRESERTLRVLVVDDSITTRTMERNMFEAAGYEVRTAADGVEAFTMLQSESFDLIVSDVDMPRMDGFEFTQKVRGSEKHAQLPIVLVTALESREDKERGVRVGANAYVLKSGFNQSNLLEIVRRLT